MFNSHRYTFEFSRAQQTYPVATFMGLLCLGLIFICLVFVWLDFNQAKEDALIQQTQYQKKQSIRAQSINEKLKLNSQPKPARKTTVSKPLFNDIALIKKQINLQWFALLGAFETAQTEDVALTQLLPNADKSTFSMTGEAKNYALLLNYIQRLEETTSLFNVHLISHEVNETHPQHPILFEIEGEWQT
jgi:hypothetical protein